MLYQPREEGQGLVEYALILVLVAIVVIVILSLLGGAVGNVFSNIVSAV
ncbi:MAG: Flp family type IVb pilin [Chloroflexota bacterium]